MTRLTIADLEIERPAEGLELEMNDGTVFALADPKAMHMETAINLESLSIKEQAAALIADGRFNDFASHPEVDGYFMEALLKKYGAHYGLGSLGEGLASPPSLNRTARRSRRT